MTVATFTCPRCLFDEPARPGPRFCPRCGLPAAADAVADTSPIDVPAGSRTCRVGDRIAVGSVCCVYRCRFPAGAGGRGEVEGVFKVARDARANDLVANEADVLRRLHAADPGGRFTPFLPAVEASLLLDGDPPSPPRRANVLRAQHAIRSPADELYTLEEVRAHYAAGLDPRDVAWIWRRLLTVLGFAHAHGVVHGAVLPPHVLIEPREHKLLLIDWCCAADRATSHRGGGGPLRIISGVEYRGWYPGRARRALTPTPSIDLSLAARCAAYLLGGGGAARGRFPPSSEPALRAYFGRCLAGPGDAWKLLEDFDRLIEALWGRRTFQVLAMPPKREP